MIAGCGPYGTGVAQLSPSYSTFSIPTSGVHVTVGDSTSNTAGSYGWPLNGSWPLTMTNSGIDGDTTANVLATVQTRVIDKNPDTVWIACMTNDVASIVSAATTSAAVLALYTSTVNAILAGCKASCKVFMMDIYTRGETWAAGPVWANTAPFAGHDAVVDALNAGLSVIEAANPTRVKRIPTRAAFLWGEVEKNPSKAQTDALTFDGIHLKVSAGFVFVQAVAARYITLT